MKIAIVGAGNIGRTLGARWAAAGHRVILGIRDPQRPPVSALLDQMAGDVRAKSVADAVDAAEVVLLALPWAAVPEVAAANAARLAGKLVIDATNNFGGPVINNLETVHDRVPTARVYRAFNSIGWENFANPRLGELQVDLFYCGPAGADAALVEGLITDVGLRPVRVGDLDAAPLVDNLGALWVRLAFQEGLGRRIAFKLLEE